VRNVKKTGDIITEVDMDLHLEGDFRKTEKKITWLAADGSDLVGAELWTFDYLLTKDTLEKDDELDDFLNPNTASMVEAVCDANLAGLTENDVVQVERKGYFRVDKAAGQGPEGRAVLFKIPTGGKE
jgi:glutamyl-tRNA synthetase